MASPRSRMTITASSRHRSDYPVKAATNATRVGIIESDGVVVIFGAGQQPVTV
jgi:hypothetical protein